MKSWFYDYFLEILLFVLIVALGWLAVHTMHKQAAGANETVFITWVMTTETGLIASLTTLVMHKAGIKGAVNGNTDNVSNGQARPAGRIE